MVIKNHTVDDSTLCFKRLMKLQTKIFVFSCFTSSIYNVYCCLHIKCANTSPCMIENSIQWDCMTCNYQKNARYQEGRIRYLEQELLASRENIILWKLSLTPLKLRTWTFQMICVSGLSRKILSPGPVVSPQKMCLKLSWATESLYYALISKAQVSWSIRKTE